jgi:hypothetical protein
MELSRAELETTATKIDRLAEFKEAIKLSEKSRGRLRAKFKTQAEFAKFMMGLPFPEKKRLVDTVISPERGGKIKIAYPRLIDVADEGLENMTTEELEKPLTDRAAIVYSEFNLDVNKTENIIRSLNRADLLGKVKVT